MARAPVRRPQRRRRKEEDVKRREQLLDEALEETFPASDPPSIANPDDDR